MEQSALCVYGHAMMSANKSGGWSIGGGPCPDWEHAKAAAVVNIEHPYLHWMSPKHLQRYVDEFAYRFNNRNEEFPQVFSDVVGKVAESERLPYKVLTA